MLTVKIIKNNIVLNSKGSEDYYEQVNIHVQRKYGITIRLRTLHGLSS